MMRRLSGMALAPPGALAALLAVLALLDAGRSPFARAAGDEARAYLPFALASTPATPAGSYNCYEYEFGLIWTSEVITLNADGSSVYDYAPPYGGTVSGTWSFTPAIHQVQFTSFRWPTATFDAPDRLWARKYLPGPDFEIALECGRWPVGTTNYELRTMNSERVTEQLR